MPAAKSKSVMRRVLVGLTVATMAIGGSLALEQDAGATAKGKSSGQEQHGNEGNHGGHHGGGGDGKSDDGKGDDDDHGHHGGGDDGDHGDHDHCKDGHGHDDEKNKHCVPEDPSD